MMMLTPEQLDGLQTLFVVLGIISVFWFLKIIGILVILRWIYRFITK